MKVNKPIIKILRKIKTEDRDKSLLDVVIKHLYDVEKMSIPEITAILEISFGSVYKTLKKKSS